MTGVPLLLGTGLIDHVKYKADCQRAWTFKIHFKYVNDGLGHIVRVDTYCHPDDDDASTSVKLRHRSGTAQNGIEFRD